MISFTFFLFVTTIFVTRAVPRIDPIVRTNVGLIRGIHSTDGRYSMFLGIPYAQVDTNNPFGPNIPQPQFEDIFDALDDSAICPQQEEFNLTITGTLDCLRLNVYVPETASSSNSLPVMVWIHGGGFNYGSGDRTIQGPAYIVRHDVILVTINYRVNVYGFMCLDIPEVPGNQGLRDQETALQWIKNNIAAFGGNDNLITIFGESAGAGSVDLHLRYGKEGLYNKVIMQSGSARSFWSTEVPDYGSAIKLAKQLGYETVDTKMALKYLTKADPLNLIAAALELHLEIWPCVEKEFDNHKRFITDYVINVPISKAKTTPILLGYNDKEWLVRHYNRNNDDYKNLTLFRDTLAKYFNFTDDELSEMEKIVKHFYIGEAEMSTDNMSDIASFESDSAIFYPAEKSIEDFLNNEAKSIHRYMFSYNGTRNFAKRKLNALHLNGAVHADELGYLFDVSFFNETPNKEDQKVIDRLTTMWTNFAKFSDPTPEVSELIPVKWPAVTSEKSYYLDIGSDLIVGTRPMHDRMAFWELFFTLNEKRVLGYKEVEGN